MKRKSRQVEEFRKSLQLEGLGQVAPVLLLADDSGIARLTVCFQCVPCEELMVWADGGGCWVCPTCSYQLDRNHGSDLLDEASAVIGRFRSSLGVPVKTKKKKGGRRWLGCFTRKKTPQLPSPS